MPKVNGNGDAYQNWNSAQASATPKMIFAVMPPGLRAPVSAFATSSCSASGALSISVAMRGLPLRQCNDNGAKSPSPRRLRGRRDAAILPRVPPGHHLIQPFSR